MSALLLWVDKFDPLLGYGAAADLLYGTKSIAEPPLPVFP